LEGPDRRLFPSYFPAKPTQTIIPGTPDSVITLSNEVDYTTAATESNTVALGFDMNTVPTAMTSCVPISNPIGIECNTNFTLRGTNYMLRDNIFP
jgi:hypothetical protein